MKIEFCKHNLVDEDVIEASDVMKSLFITTGKKTTQFENEFAKYVDNKYAIGLTSCTAGLFLLLKYFNLPKNSEIILSPLSFAASANTVIQAGYIPVFCDVEKNTGNIDVAKIEEKINSKTRGIVAVHLYGQMCDMKSMSKLAKKHNLFVIEDAAHCVEGIRDNVKPGQLSEGAAYSFYATKNLTCGEGGAVTTNNEQIADYIKVARLHGLSKSAINRYNSNKFSQYDMEIMGYKFNMNDIQAALLLKQLNRLEASLNRRKEIWDKFEDAFNGKIERPEILSNTKHAMHLYTIWVDKDKREKIIDKLYEAGIPVSIHFRAIHLLKYYQDNLNYKEGDFPITEEIANKTITLPFYPKLTDDEVDYIIKNVLKIVSG